MASKSKVRISEKSALPIVAAVLSFLAAVLTLVGKWQILKRFPLFYAIMTVIFPITAFLLFTIFALIFAKKHLLLMLIPIFMICIQHILNESGVYTTLLYGSSGGYYGWMWRYNPVALILSILACLLTMIIFIVCSATFAGAVKNKLPLIILCVLNIFINIALQLCFFVTGTNFVIPWYTFSVIAFLCAFILLASDLQNSTAMQGPAPGFMNPPFPGMPPYPPNAMYQQTPNQGMPAVNQQMAFQDQSMMDRQKKFFGQPGQQMPYAGQPVMNQQMPYQGQPVMNHQMPYPGQPMMNQQMPYPIQPVMNHQMPYPSQQEGRLGGYQAEQYMNQPAPEQIQGTEVAEQLQQADKVGQLQEALAVEQVQELAAAQERPEDPTAEAQLPGQE